MFCVELGGSYSPRRHWCFKQPDFGSKGLGPAYRSLMTFGHADHLVYEFATHSIATPGRLVQHRAEVCIETHDSFLTSRRGLTLKRPDAMAMPSSCNPTMHT